VADPEDRARGNKRDLGTVFPAGLQGEQPPEAGVLMHSV